MKTWILSLAVLASSAMAHASNQASGMKTFPVTQAQIAKAHFDEEFQSGSLVVNYDENNVTLILDRKSVCPVGNVCAAVMPSPKVIQLPIVSIEEGNCGATKVSAQNDDRNRDGILEQINVIDNTTMVCRILIPFDGTATYVTSTLGQSEENATQTSKMILGGHGSKFSF